MDSREHNAEKEAEAVIAGNEGPMLRYAMHLIGDSTAAQDAVEEAFVQVFGYNPKNGALSGSGLQVRLFRAVGDAAAKRISKRGRAKQGARSPASAANAAFEAVRKLDFTGMQVVILKICEGKSSREIGLITGLSTDCVDEMLGKSIIKTAEELKKAGLL